MTASTSVASITNNYCLVQDVAVLCFQRDLEPNAPPASPGNPTGPTLAKTTPTTASQARTCAVEQVELFSHDCNPFDGEAFVTSTSVRRWGSGMATVIRPAFEMQKPSRRVEIMYSRQPGGPIFTASPQRYVLICNHGASLHGPLVGRCLQKLNLKCGSSGI